MFEQVPPTRLGTSPGPLRLQTRERIMEAAGVIFAERGYPAATVRRIAAAANANIAAINYHFGSKANLYRAVVDRALKRLGQGVATHGRGSRDDPGVQRLVDALIDTFAGGHGRQDGKRTLARLIAWEFIHALDGPHEADGEPNNEASHLLTRHLPEGLIAEERQLVALWMLGQCLALASPTLVAAQADRDRFASLMREGLSGFLRGRQDYSDIRPD